VVRGDMADRDAVHEACAGCRLRVPCCGRAGHRHELPWREYDSINVLGTDVIDGELSQAAGVGAAGITPAALASTFAGRDQQGVDESAPYPALAGGGARILPAFEGASRASAVIGANGDRRPAHVLAAAALGVGTGRHAPHAAADCPGEVAGRLRRVGDGTNLVDVTYVENAAEAHLLAAEAFRPARSRRPARPTFLSQGEPVNCWQWIDEILALAELPPVEKSMSFKHGMADWAPLCEACTVCCGFESEPPMTRFLAAQLATSHWFDISAARRDLGYEPRVSTAEGMQRLGEWLRQCNAKPQGAGGPRLAEPPRQTTIAGLPGVRERKHSCYELTPAANCAANT
jgi:2-alkyl-3-oxoalkanoate reductase